MDTHTLHNVHRYRWTHIHYTMYTGIDGHTYTTQCTQVYIQSLLAAGAVWLNLGPPRQPEGRTAVVGRDAAKLPRLPGEIVFIIMELILDSNSESSKK